MPPKRDLNRLYRRTESKRQIMPYWAFKILVVIIIMIAGSTVASVDQIEQLSTRRAFFSTVQADNKLFFIGGFEHHDFIASNRIDVFNLANNTWDQSLNLTKPRGRISTAVIGPRIYMVGGYEATAIPIQYLKGQFNFTSDGLTSGPTVRRPIQLSLHNSTLTVVGYFSVDFMDTNTKNWTHNEQLTEIMSNLYDTTTVAHLNFVFVIGGINTVTQQPSTSIWTINATLSKPFEVNVTSASFSEFVGSWFDEDHEAVVVQFFTQCIVYQPSSHKWFHRPSLNNSISAVSYKNSTIVFFTDGYWTIDWHSMTDTWTALDQITFAFTIADQLVYCAGNQMSIVTATSVKNQTVTTGQISLTKAMSPSVYVLVNATSTIFMYNASAQLLKQSETIYGNTPLKIFRSNSSLVHIVTNNSQRRQLVTFDDNGALIQQSSTDNVPDALIEDYFYRFGSTSRRFSWQNPSQVFSYYSFSATRAIWAQQDNTFYLMSTSSLSSAPIGTNEYTAVDVYNYVDKQWEDSIPAPESVFASGVYVPTAVLNNTLCLIAGNSFFQLNETGGWNGSPTAFSGPIATGLIHPTYAPVAVVDNRAYVSDNGAGLLITSTAMDAVRTSATITAYARQLVHTDTKIVLSLIYGDFYSNIAVYDIPSQQWATVLYQPPETLVSVVMYDEWLLAFGDDMTSVSYLNTTSLHWDSQPFDNSIVPASLFTMMRSNSTTLVLAGGFHRSEYHYVSDVRFVTLNLTPSVNVTTPSVVDTLPTAETPSAGSIADDSSNTVVIAVVVPVGAAVIAGALLTVFLVRRKQRRQRATTTTIGLEQQFGEWFVPFNDIQFGKQLGQGANGQVFKGKWKNTDVALKMSMAQANQSVIAELSLMINMRPHPNVVQLLGFSVNPETNSVILILEYCNGGSLDTVLYNDDNVVKIETKLHWLKCICKGLGHLHANNLVHRDIAARNVMLHQGEPKLTDFGMTRVVDEQQQHGTTKSELGPIRWMAPESLSLKQYSAKSDVWSFGILMYEVLVQQEPHVDADPIEIGRRIRDEGVTPQLPTSLECWSDFSAIMTLCCVMDPKYRPSIDQVLEKLEHIPL